MVGWTERGPRLGRDSVTCEEHNLYTSCLGEGEKMVGWIERGMILGRD